MEYCKTPANPNALPCVHWVMEYLAGLAGNGILTGQHTQTMAQEELHHIEKITGRQPALLGFELLAYSPNINYLETDEACMTEVQNNYGTLKRAWEWAEHKGLITFTWHWFSPLGGHGKSFFTENTDFDADRALTEGTPENRAIISDMDTMAGILRPFCDRQVPILWRPFHESEGKWFWWGSKGPETAARLYRMMYERFTGVHGLNNLIWVWNSPLPEGYPGDDVVDIISRDTYPPAHSHTSHHDKWEELRKITPAEKITLIGEIGSLPDISAVEQDKTGWVSFMAWSGIFCLREDFTDFPTLKAVYSHPYAVTKDRLPVLY